MKSHHPTPTPANVNRETLRAVAAEFTPVFDQADKAIAKIISVVTRLHDSLPTDDRQISTDSKREINNAVNALIRYQRKFGDARESVNEIAEAIR